MKKRYEEADLWCYKEIFRIPWTEYVEGKFLKEKGTKRLLTFTKTRMKFLNK